MRPDFKEAAVTDASPPVDFSNGFNQEYKATLLVIDRVHDTATQELTLLVGGDAALEN